MPPNRPLRKAACANPKYIYSDDDDDGDDDDAFTEPVLPKKNARPVTAPLLSLPARSSHTRKRPPNYIRRPRNAFIIFRSEFCEEQKMNETGVESDHRQISRIAAHVWNSLREEEKAPYRKQAQEEKEAHKRAYPGYRYAPTGRPRIAIRHKEKRDDTEDTSRCRKIADLLLCGFQGREFIEAAKKLTQSDPSIEPLRKTAKVSRGKGHPQFEFPRPALSSAAIELESSSTAAKVTLPSSPQSSPSISPSPSPSPPPALTSSPTSMHHGGTNVSPISSTFLQEKGTLIHPLPPQAKIGNMEPVPFNFSLRECDREMIDDRESRLPPAANMMLSYLNTSNSASASEGISDWGTLLIPLVEKVRLSVDSPVSESSIADSMLTSSDESFSAFIPGEAGDPSECDNMELDYPMHGTVGFSDYLVDIV